MKKFRCWLALSLPLILASTCGAQDDLTILLRRVPETADALLIVRLQALLDSPRGQQENWSEKYQLGYLNGAVRIPPVVKDYPQCRRQSDFWGLSGPPPSTETASPRSASGRCAGCRRG